MLISESEALKAKSLFLEAASKYGRVIRWHVSY